MLKSSAMKDIVPYLLSIYNVSKITDIPTFEKVKFLCSLMDLSFDGFDSVLSENPPVFRTVKGHVFESYFDELLVLNGYISQEVGGDTSVDRIVNGHSLQLKTPYEAGTRGNIVQYKCHKTHGAKSEQESMSYYHSLEEFPDYLVGLISYNPQKILILHKSELPLVNTTEGNYILSPFKVDLSITHAVNAFSRLGIFIDPQSSLELQPHDSELLPKTSLKCGVTTEVIINTILNVNNFRMWDMAIKGFCREYSFESYCYRKGIVLKNPNITNRLRYDKADFVVPEGASYSFLQMKGVSINNCKLDIDDPIIATETQLTRGRVNDHPTQSRLYLAADFDFLILAIDPVIAHQCNQLGEQDPLMWEYYKIPTSVLSTHHIYTNRLSSLQRFTYSYLQQFKM